MIRIAVCDDNEIQRELLCEMINEFISLKDVDFLKLFSYDSPVNMLDAVNAGTSFDICILDLIMPEMFGIDLAKSLRSAFEKAKIIFFSSSADFVFQSFEVDTFDYLIKPVDAEKLFSTLDRAICDIVKERDNMRKSREEIITNISHEMKTPLTVISGYTQMIMAKLRNNPELTKLVDFRGSLSNITNETQKLGNLISQFTDTNKASVMSPVSLYDMTQDIQDVCTEVLSQKRNRLDISVSEEMPQVYADKTLALYVMKNLMTLLNDHYTDSVVYIRTTHRQGSSHVKVIVYAGSDDEVQQSILEISRTGWSSGGASALNIDICSKNMAQMGGKLEIKSNADNEPVIELVFNAAAQ